MSEAVILTREGYENLKKELEQLKTVERAKVAERLKIAIGFGDLSENSEYDDAKIQQAFIEGRIATIEAMLPNVQVIDEDQLKKGGINLGSYVTVLDTELDEQEEYRIVGTSEADPMHNKISNESPLGKVLLGKNKGDVVQAETPAGMIEYKILDVHRESSAAKEG
jgi:transcription elongation factor GreA